MKTRTAISMVDTGTGIQRCLRATTAVWLGVFWCGLSCTSETGTTTVLPRRDFTPVFLLDTEMLEPPAIEAGNVFKPTLLFDSPGDNAPGNQSAGFFLTLAVGDVEALQVRIVDLESGNQASLMSVAPPSTEAELAVAGNPNPFNGITREALAAGQGVFWPAVPAGGEGDVDADRYEPSLAKRFAVLVPGEHLSAFSRLEMFTHAADDGTPLGAVAIELVQDFFYMAVIGDSVQWGNGLKEEDKMSTLVGEFIEHEMRRRVILQRYAHSGARIVPAEGDSICQVSCTGEVPSVSTSITLQAEQIQHPELIDFVLMDGCINDVNVVTIINPLRTDEELVTLSEQFCRNEMATLLHKVHLLAPQARIVVTGYYQIVSPESDIFGLRQWALANGLVSEADDAMFIEALTEQAIRFRDSTHQSLGEAVGNLNADTGGEPVAAFADPAFGPEHAVFTDDPWLWSMTSDNELFEDVDSELELFPEDPLKGFRLRNCFTADPIGGIIPCLYASVGHPTPAGARAYADAIIEGLRDLGVLVAEAGTG
ncbi:MAG: SGNH/GDSL hydrolase family protein [Planctomycetota bacterium]|jgi:hypothetical protein